MPTGIQTITLTFDGKTLRDLGRDGPYTLSNFFILYNDTNFYSAFTVDMRQNLYTTTAYSHRQVEGYLLKLLHSSEEVTDPDGDGLYNRLIVKVQLDVLAPGPYAWTGQLVDQFNMNIGWVEGAGYLDSQTPMTFVYDGAVIHRKGLTGPYRLRNVAVHRTDGNPLNMHWDDVYTTAAYSANQFARETK
ncbi:MAG: hypothetical protein DYG89_00025 [Caldilinea sp. CFX5]|nr:hypothetical protein [Caldilinea sp. CFX5]